jgi:uncharacterized membrane protein YhaH (DUF805 family)
MIQYWTSALKNYANFNGRARRSEYWYFTLMNTIILIGLQVFAGVCASGGMGSIAMILGLLYLIYSLGTLIPSIAVGVRRMHDVGKSGWFLLIPIYNLILACTDSQAGSNEYGLNPKTGTEDLINTIK